jgi:calcineurin-like phosphoesterase family protein
MRSTTKNRWLISDTHWQHDNVLKFTKEDGSLVRPEFSCIQEMDEILIQNWNNEVKSPEDIVYHLGDVTFGSYERFCTVIAPRLMGKKRLIIGNHDRLKGTKLMNFFEKVALWYPIESFGYILTHIPIEKCFFRGRCTHNVHGHLHEKTLKSPIHANVSVERIGYRPINLEEVNKLFGS